MSLSKSDDPELQQFLDEKGYQYISPIGSSGSATCFLVHSARYNVNFVVKKMVINDKTICSDCELYALKQLSGPGIINMYDYSIKKNLIFIVLEYCKNGSLLSLIKDEGPIKGKKLISLCKTLLKALQTIHHGRFAHLDIKPANILIDRYGRAKMADFGIARFIRPDENNMEDQKAGTLYFMAPEIHNLGIYDPFKADVWSLGVTFYYIATKKVPFVITTIEEFKKSLNSRNIMFPANFPNYELAIVIKKMLTVEPELRPTVDEILQYKIFNQTFDKNDEMLVKSQLISSPLSQCRKMHENLRSHNDVALISKHINHEGIPSNVNDHPNESNHSNLNKDSEYSGDETNQRKCNYTKAYISHVKSNLSTKKLAGNMILGNASQIKRRRQSDIYSFRKMNNI
ncbi:AGC family protein kinase [Tritrichomonas foetus]|uniref:AGC family protein kinase n=1 Tax=Tritrichomonas foetus TaxID=1144522 RepID=A0A1J4KT60_9EUKA|nr:AGC family protein kinase [Tritrichomonas foetus]|eukprot:OHT12846.1 AGC family protein kinase [Tritrichomonas foetus]